MILWGLFYFYMVPKLISNLTHGYAMWRHSNNWNSHIQKNCSILFRSAIYFLQQRVRDLSLIISFTLDFEPVSLSYTDKTMFCIWLFSHLPRYQHPRIFFQHCNEIDFVLNINVFLSPFKEIRWHSHHIFQILVGILKL